MLKTTNPWFTAAVARAQVTYAGTPDLDAEVANTRDEYARHGAEQSRRCRCGRTMWFKASVGAYKCSCGLLQTEGGKFL